MIGIATGLFLISLGGCSLFYLIKSFRDGGGATYGSTDSTASVQSGSSKSMGESQASATDM